MFVPNDSVMLCCISVPHSLIESNHHWLARKTQQVVLKLVVVFFEEQVPWKKSEVYPKDVEQVSML